MAVRRREIAELVLNARKGDKSAFTELVRAYENAAYATALTYVPRVEDAQDIVQDAFINAYCKLARLREPERFGTWLGTIVRRQALEWLRRERAVRFTHDRGDAAESALENVARGNHSTARRNAELWDAVFALPENYREVVLAYYLNGFSYGRVADYLGLTVPTVKGRLHRSRIRLKEHLASEEKEELTMKRANVGKKVEEAIYKIAREEINQTIPLDGTTNIVLFCGIESDIEVCQADGENLILTGSKTSLGVDEQDAKKSITGIKVFADQVENYLETGPHAGEYLWGTGEKDGKPVPIKQRIPDQWRVPKEIAKGTSFEPTELFPEIATSEGEIVRALREGLRKVTRITVIRERIDDVAMSRTTFTEELHRAFALKYSSGDVLYGSRGRVDLVVGVPAHKTITVLSKGRDAIRVWGLTSNLNVVGGSDVEVSDVEGDVRLLNTSVKSAKGVRGRLIQSYYNFGGTEARDDETKIRRLDAPDSTIHDVVGEVVLDLGRVNLTASDLRGKVDIRNRFGTTRFHLSRHEPGSTYRIQADSGEVIAFLKEALVPAAINSTAKDNKTYGEAVAFLKEAEALVLELSVTVHTLCGRLTMDALKGRSYTRHYTPGLISHSTVQGRMALAERDAKSDLVIKTRDGDITIEKTV